MGGKDRETMKKRNEYERQWMEVIENVRKTE